MKQYLVLTIFTLFFNSSPSFAQDSFIYTLDCGIYGYYTTEYFYDSLGLETDFNNSVLITKNGTSKLTKFTHSNSNQRKHPIELKSFILLNVYPQLVHDSFYINFEVMDDCEALVQIVDMYGRNFLSEKLNLQKGVNIFQRERIDVVNGHYFIKAQVNNKFSVKKIVFL